MKKRVFFRWALSLLVLCLSLAVAQADDAGVLTESELGEWVTQTLLETVGEEALNAPVGEESHTPEGYAFMHSFATLYYDRPVVDENSILQGFAITDESVVTPRGIRLGSPVEALIEAYGWLNPELYGDGTFAALYLHNQLPEGAYWSWGQLVEGELSSVQCAVHAAARTQGLYTDAGVVYQVQDGIITSIRVYGLDQVITLSEVQSNLRAVSAALAAVSGDEEHPYDLPAEGYFVKNTATAFDGEDLTFSRMDFLTLGETGASLLFGAPKAEDWALDDTGEWLQTMHRDALTLTYMLDANKQNPRLESLSITKPGVEGPRGIQIGDSLESVLSRFRSDGTGETLEGEALLYGNGLQAPSGALRYDGEGATLRYMTSAQGSDGKVREVTLWLSFWEDQLAEILLHAW